MNGVEWLDKKVEEYLKALGVNTIDEGLAKLKEIENANKGRTSG